MNVYEMEGFLRGKCLPGDLKVNESTASYLVRKINSTPDLQPSKAMIDAAWAEAYDAQDIDLEEDTIVFMWQAMIEAMRKEAK